MQIVNKSWEFSGFQNSKVTVFRGFCNNEISRGKMREWQGSGLGSFNCTILQKYLGNHCHPNNTFYRFISYL